MASNDGRETASTPDSPIDRVVEFSIRNRALVIFGVLLLAAVGLRSATRIPIDAVPDVTNVQVQVLTTAPGLGPLEVEQSITLPIEAVMNGLPLLEEVRSLSRVGLSSVTVVFEEDTDTYFARQLVSERLQAAQEALPAGLARPEMGPISTGLGEIFQFEVRGEPSCAAGQPDTQSCYTPMELRTLLDWEIAVRLRAVPGIVEINTFGGELKTYEVQLDPSRMTALGISIDQVFEALERNNANAGGAYIEHVGEQYLVRGEGLVQSLDDIRAIVVTTRREGTPIRIANLAEVAIAPMVRYGAVTRDGRGEAVVGIAMMLMGANSRDVANDVKTRLASIARSLPQGVRIEPFYDRSALVSRTIRTVTTNLIEGGALVIVVLLLLLGNLRGGLLVASAIPLSMLAAFIAMERFGVTANLMSLGAIDFGLIVDGAVVIVENAVHALESPAEAQRRLHGRLAAATRQVARPVAFAISIIVLVYVPVFALRGIEGKMFRPMAFTVVAALVASLVLALTWIPAMATLVFRKGSVRQREGGIIPWVRRHYEPWLLRFLAHPRRTLAVALGIFVASLALLPLLGAAFVPTLDEGAIAIHAIRLPSVSLEESIAATGRIERALLEHFPAEIQTVVSKTGRAEIATDPMGVDQSDVFVMLTPRATWQHATTSDALAAAIRDVLAREVPGQHFSFSQPIELRTNELISGVRSDVAINIYGDDLDELRRIGDDVVRVIEALPGAADVKAESVAGLPFLRVRVRRDRLARYGINAAEVLHAVEVMGGRQVGEVFEGQRRFALQVRYIKDVRNNLLGIDDIPIAAPDGTLVPLGQLADIVIEEGPAQISRDQVHRRLTVEANVHGRDLAGFVAQAQARIEIAGVVPPGYHLSWGGQFENLRAAFRRLAFAVPISLLLIFVLLYAHFHDWRPALLIYLNVPLAATGGIVALLLRSMPFTISAAVGFIVLFGIAVLNGVVLISHAHDLHTPTTPRSVTVARAALDRLRPVLMTATVAAFGFVPMAVATGAGAEVQRPLATVVIGGLITSTLLTLLVLPTVYAWFAAPPDRCAASGNSAV